MGPAADAKPPAPHLNVPLHRWEGGTPPNDMRTAFIPNPMPYPGHPKAPPPPRYRAPYGDEVPFKAPPPDLAQLPGLAVRRDLAVIKAPPAQVFNVPEHLLKARAPHVIAALALELPRPKNTAVAVVGGG